METYFGHQPTKLVFVAGNFQDGNTRNNSAVPSKRGMGDFTGFQRRIFPHSHQSEIMKVPQVFLGKETYQFTVLPFGLATAPLEFYQSSQGSKTHGTSKGYQDPPVPR